MEPPSNQIILPITQLKNIYWPIQQLNVSYNCRPAFACFHWHVCRFILSNELLLFQVGGSLFHHPGLYLRPFSKGLKLELWLGHCKKIMFFSANHFFTTFAVCFGFEISCFNVSRLFNVPLLRLGSPVHQLKRDPTPTIISHQQSPDVLGQPWWSLFYFSHYCPAWHRCHF